MKKDETMKYKCCICGRKYTGWGNNPYPVSQNSKARCCDSCNSSVVIPARIMKLYK